MNKIITFFRKNYIYVNITFLLLTIYVILFPFFSNIIEQINPLLVKCPYLTITGKPCPLCGGTRYVAGIGNALNDITYLFHPFGIIIMATLGQLIFRIYNIVTRKKEKSDRYIKIDMTVLIFLFICFSLYEIFYIVFQNIE